VVIDASHTVLLVPTSGLCPLPTSGLCPFPPRQGFVPPPPPHTHSHSRVVPPPTHTHIHLFEYLCLLLCFQSCCHLMVQ
jgi:hypothetical protein